MFKRFYQFILSKAQHPQALWIMGAISFAESSFFPVPPDILLIPMCIAQPRKAWRYALVCTLASVVGGIFGYFIGYTFFDFIGLKIVQWYGLTERFHQLQYQFAQHAFTIIALKGLTPIPYKLVTIGSGIASVPMMTFLSASIITRGVRFFILSGLTSYFGPHIHKILEKHMMWFMIGTCLVLGLGMYVLRFF